MIYKKTVISALLLAGTIFGVHSTSMVTVDSTKDVFKVDNPYEHVKWEKVIYTPSTSHIHIMDQKGLNTAYKVGYRHLPISNYYPSAPYYPIDKMRDNQFRVKQDHGVVVTTEEGKATFMEGPIYWNDIIMDNENGWYHLLTKEQQNQMPFKEGGLIFKTIPEDVVFSPNAEHHSFTDLASLTHVCAVGSFYSSGTFDAQNLFKSAWGAGNYSYGVGLPWKEAFNKMLDKLQFKDGGGITINHPKWSKLSQSDITQMLDYDPRVLGIEVMEGSVEGKPVWSTEIWDDILLTGRKCLGFFVPDWGIQEQEVYAGFNVLLVDESTEYACLKAYREGRFFGSELGKSLVFTDISYSKGKFTVKTNQKANINFIADGVEMIVKSECDSATFKVPVDTNGIPTIKYIRAEAQTKDDGRILTQPIRFVKL